MLNEEAIKVIKNNWPSSNYSMLIEAVTLAIEALEKQIPKEPIFEINCVAIDGVTPSGCPVCPICKEPHYNLDWCAFCGQKLLHKEDK